LTERINPKGWRVISNRTRQPDLEAEELKTLIQTMQKQQQVPGSKGQPEETSPPEAA
jgi:hypothetical protein